jgi:hypothetical protein
LLAQQALALADHGALDGLLPRRSQRTQRGRQPGSLSSSSSVCSRLCLQHSSSLQQLLALPLHAGWDPVTMTSA